MATRSERRTIWLVVAGLGFALLLIGLFLSRSVSLAALNAGIGLCAMLAGFIKYRALAPRRRKLHDD